MDLLTYCSLSGVCYNLATQFLLKVPWDKVLKDTAVLGSKKIWSSRNAYTLVLKEAQMAQEVYRYFKNTINKIDRYQKQLNVNICSLQSAKTFLSDFAKVLQLYDPKNVTSWQNNIAGESLRQQLQYYTTFMHSMMTNISLELQYVTMQLQTIQTESNPSKKQQLLNMLQESCSIQYGDNDESVQEDDDGSTDDTYSDASEDFN